MVHSLKSQLLNEIKSIVLGYPKFVYFNSDIKNTPVFLYHTIDPELFESHLQYLKNNGYRTLNVHEYVEAVNSKKSGNNKSVLLTIDDARSSVWRFAFPLLKRYGMNATVFIIPGLTMETDLSRFNLLDVWNGKSSMDEIQDIDTEDNTLCSWQEISEMYKSGLVNIELHTLFHREIFRNLNIIDFITPDKMFLLYNFCGSAYLTSSDIGKELNPDKYYGLPLFESDPLMLAGPKLNISSEFITKCKEIYYKYDSSGHSNDNWKTEIKNLVSDTSSVKKYFDLCPNSKDDVSEDLGKAREIIQNKLDKDAGNHLCLPWTIGNSETINLAKDLGIRSCFWGVLPGKKSDKFGNDSFFISRIKNDFIFRLPGKGRKSFLSIYSYKLKRRASKEHIF